MWRGRRFHLDGSGGHPPRLENYSSPSQFNPADVWKPGEWKSGGWHVIVNEPTLKLLVAKDGDHSGHNPPAGIELCLWVYEPD